MSMWSLRASYCAEALIRITDLHHLNRPLRPDPKHTVGVAIGWAPIHMCCNGVDVHGRRPAILQQLISAKADVNMRSESEHYTYPAVLAGSQGFTSALKVLASAGANKYVRNHNGVGVAWSANRCSSTTRRWCEDQEIPSFEPDSSGRTRGDHCNPSRVFRKLLQQSFIDNKQLDESRDGFQPSGQGGWACHHGGKGYKQQQDDDGKVGKGSSWQSIHDDTGGGQGQDYGFQPSRKGKGDYYAHCSNASDHCNVESSKEKESRMPSWHFSGNDSGSARVRGT